MRSQGTAGDVVAALGQVTLRVAELENAREGLDDAVDIARNAGASWSLIGQAAGITAQAANARWNPEVRRKRTEYQRNRNRSGRCSTLMTMPRMRFVEVPLPQSQHVREGANGPAVVAQIGRPRMTLMNIIYPIN